MITFEYPGYAEEPTSSITLRSPEINDGYDDTQELVIKESRDGGVRTQEVNRNFVADKTTCDLLFTDILQVDIETLRAFIIKAEGSYVKYTDYDDVEWICVFINSTLDIEYHTNCRGEVGNFTVNIVRWKDA